ncbi:uncharacterized protein LOC112882673 isoform X1 [Panicum hallii]|uniref:uncharacterized protein LOC112882673 isoform X1 n=1 Tax=Panicum hallii TaxID=206008 RepID=UPI000DF4EF5A|nr:uncharacterized protein LOC112882673 isoform X1 [Panicum hallii]
MDPCTAPPEPSTWRRAVRRRSLDGAGVPPGCRRAEELEEAVWRLRAEKEAAERAAAALRAELDAERGAAATAATETMLMIARLQREKAAAMMEARELQALAEGRALRECELHDRLAAVSALAASYAALLRAHGVDPEEAEDGGNYEDEDDDHSVEYLEADADGDGESHGGDAEATAVTALVAEEPPSPPTAEEESEYTADVQCVPCAATTEAAAPPALREASAARVAEDPSLYGRVAALEAESAAMRREVAALRAERALVVLARELARRLCLQAAADERAAVAAAERPRFSALAICRVLVLITDIVWLFSTIIWGKTHSASAASSSSGSSTSSHLRQILLLGRSKGDHRIQISRSPPRNQMPVSGETGLAGCEKPWSSPL